MGIKSEVITQDTAEKPSYPYLGMYAPNGTVVLFTARNTGTLLLAADPIDRVGEYSGDWTEFVFDPLDGALTLRNDE